MALTEQERWGLIEAAAALQGQAAELAALAASEATTSLLVLKANGLKARASALFDDFLDDVTD